MMKHLPTLTALVLLSFNLPVISAADWGPWRALSMAGDAKQQWHFIGGQWSGDEHGAIEPPHNNEDRWLAFNTAEAYADFEVEFDFRINYMISGCGFIFRARDAQH